MTRNKAPSYQTLMSAQKFLRLLGALPGNAPQLLSPDEILARRAIFPVSEDVWFNLPVGRGTSTYTAPVRDIRYYGMVLIRQRGLGVCEVVLLRSTDTGFVAEHALVRGNSHQSILFDDVDQAKSALEPICSSGGECPIGLAWWPRVNFAPDDWGRIKKTRWGYYETSKHGKLGRWTAVSDESGVSVVFNRQYLKDNNGVYLSFTSFTKAKEFCDREDSK